jgi:hypothetical protein
MLAPYRKAKAFQGVFYTSVLTPEGLTTEHVEKTMEHTRKTFVAINQGLITEELPPINEVIQSNSYSGLLHGVATDLLARFSEFEKTRDTVFPDLKHPKTGCGLEVKTTSSKSPWSTFGHNPGSGWYIAFEFDIAEGLPDFSKTWVGELSEEDFTVRERAETSKRTRTASVKKDSWDKKMKKVFERGGNTSFVH